MMKRGETSANLLMWNKEKKVTRIVDFACGDISLFLFPSCVHR